jgi:glyoxylase-like metal-dependent hydrolase (beta-lactamase superfamily II)
MQIKTWAAALLLASGIASAQTSPPTPALPPGFTLVPGSFLPGGQPDGNSLLIEGPEGLLLLDTGRHVAQAQALIAAVRARGKPLRWIVNSHWHLDHIGGNALLREAFPEARLMASEAIVGARSGFLARYRTQLAEQLAGMPEGDARRVPLQRELAIIDDTAAQTPQLSVTGGSEQRLAGRPLWVGLAAQAVTAGDVWLYDPAAKVLAAGDLVTLPVPFFDTACPARWSAALGQLAERPFERLVPGHGPVLTRDDFVRYRHGFDSLLRCAAGSAPAASCIGGWIEALGPLLPESEHKTTRAYLGYYLDEHLRAAPAKANANCPNDAQRRPAPETS